MRLLLTGATGFLGNVVIEKLLERGDYKLVALVRSDRAAKEMEARGLETVMGDVLDRRRLDAAVKDVDGVIHMAGDVRTGIPESERRAMFDVNVEGTRNTLGAAANAQCGRVLNVSTNNAFGDTHGKAVDETYQRPADEPFKSAYEESKFKALEVGRGFAGDGLDLVTVLPSMVYGPNKTAMVGRQIEKAATGKLRAVFFGDMGLDMAYIDDVADGLIAALERGKAGEEYMLSGERSRLRDVLAMAARIGGQQLPRLVVPDSVTKRLLAVTPLIRALGMPTNGEEVFSTAANGVTLWGDYTKAALEIGYSPRGLDEGLRSTVHGLISD